VPHELNRVPDSVRDLFQSGFRIVVGVYWLYFASTKWTGLDWTRGVIEQAAIVNPIPGLHQVLVEVVAPQWYAFSLAQTVGETIVAICLIIGLATRAAGVLGSVLALGLVLALSFAVSDVGFRWLYYLTVLVNLELIAWGPGSAAVQNYRFIPRWLMW